ncbi:putative E3 ubiquitin-protein ligase XBAT31 isoform X2 [Lycium barbarum]|uniref:putative E3 ubiquitin-protein ligase XBAT31 isoform X2 n=1 Tax=Lycium barbarum TaxID=112863 RepID=UPI00293F7256|nr:putative E3 ubiquitin-protein ligase XBAT31 isoform X2 [Lycium barbarum]
MGQNLSSCVQQQPHHEHNGLFIAVQNGELDKVEAMINEEPNVVRLNSVRGKLSALHVAAANGQIEVLCMLLDRGVNPDILNRHKQTPLMLAAMHGNVSCVERLIQRGANILTFDSLHGRTCLHYAAYHGHCDCLQSILASAHSAPVAQSWGFARFVNIRDGSGATPLHLAARHGRPACVRILLSNEALVCASSGGYGRPGSTPLHLAARGGSLDCIRELLAWGADRLYRDSSGRIPYMVALKYKHGACAALLNPSSPEPLTWPSPLKFISELDAEAKALLENALIEANKDREKLILEKTAVSNTSSLHSDSGLESDDFEGSDLELCCICFEQACTIEIQKCGHQMCAHCTLALCCHNKPNPASNNEKVPVCPFCRSDITHLAVVQNKIDTYEEVLSPSRLRKSRTSFSLTEGSGSSSSSSSLRVLSPLASFGKLGGRHSGKISAETIEVFAKP